MSLFQNRISWNEIKKIVEDYTSRTVSGDPEAVLLHYADLAAIQALDHQYEYAYFGDVHMNDDSFGEQHIFQYIFPDDTPANTMETANSGVATYGNIVRNVLFNKVAAIPSTAGCTHVLAYKIPLATAFGTIYTYSNATLPVTGWSKAGTTYTHAAGTANTLSFALSLPAGNYVLYATATLSAGSVDFGTDETGAIIQLTGTGSQSGSYEFYSNGSGSVLTVIPSSSFVGSFAEANIYIKQIIYS